MDPLNIDTEINVSSFESDEIIQDENSNEFNEDASRNSIKEIENINFDDQPITHNGKQIDPVIKKQLELYLKENSITDYTMKMSPGSNPGENMIGIIAKVDINGKIYDQNIELNWIVKIAPESEQLRKMLPIELIFNREVYVYDILFRLYRQLENEKHVVKRFDSYPEFFFSHLEPLKEFFVMQDLKSLDYVIKNKKEPLDLEHVKLVMKAYGKMHALSFALKHYTSETFESVTKKLEDIFTLSNDLENFKSTHQIMVDSAKNALDPNKDGFYIKKFQKYVDNFFDIFIEGCTANNQYSVIGQGDSWITNMLFKYDDPNYPSLPKHVCLLDFQLARYASPACDLSYFIFTCTDKTFRNVHYDNMIRLYYYTLCGHLNDLGCNPEIHLPFEALQAELKRYSIVGMHMSFMALVAMTREVDELPDMREDSTSDMVKDKIAAKSRNQEMYDQRVREIIVDVIQKGYLDFLQ